MRRAATGLGALAVLLAALFGVPLGLTALGQGPPGGLPSWAAVSGGLSRSITDSALLRSASLLCWLVWALFVVAVLVEVVSQAVGWARRVPARRPRIAIPGLQACARTLVLSAVLLLPQRAMVGAFASPGPAATVPAVTTTTPAGPLIARFAAPAAARAAPAAPAAVPAAPPPVPTPPSATADVGGHRYVVRRYDSLWSIAEHHLGSGTRWREIRDVSGGALGRDGQPPWVIHPGQVVLLPLSGATTPVAPSARANETPSTPVVQTAVAPRLAPTTPPIVAAPPAPPTTRTTLAPPTTLATPAAPAPTAMPATLATPATPATSAPPVDPPTTSSPPPTMVEVAAARGSSSANAGTLLEAGLAGAAILSLVGLLRRRQARHRPPGRRIRLPDAALAGTELVLRRSQTPDRHALIQKALTTLDAEAPPIVGLLVDNDSVELLLAHPTPPPAPWAASAEGFRWRIDAADIADLPPSTNDGSAPLPALAPLGRVAAGRADALLNLEAAGLVSVDGDPARAAGLLHAVATNLLGAPWARAANLVLIGFPPSLSAPDNVRSAASLDDLADELRETAAVMAATLRQNHCPDALTGRLGGIAGDGWPPVVVLCARRPTTSEAQLLASVTTPGSGVVAVVANAGAGSAPQWTIDIDRQPCPVNPLRLAVEPTVLDAATAAAIAELLEIAQDNAGTGLGDPPYDRIELSAEVSVDRSEVSPPKGNGTATHTATHNGTHRHSRGDRAAPPDVGDPPILVRVLGSVEVEGAAEFKRAKSRELVVYLAMHPNGVGEAELDEALWGSAGARVVISSTRDSTVSVARSALGGAARLLPAQGQGREKLYRLGPEVASDWSQFCTLHRYGRQHRSAAALHQALELVRGRPFEAVVSGRTFGWIHTEGHGRHIEAEVADAADLAAGLCLDAGDPIAARWAARRGLVAEPYTERLWVRLMEAADALGESQEIERIMDEMDVVLELEGDFTGLHPNTLAAYDRLSRRHRFPADR